MLLRHLKPSVTEEPIENTFEAIDDRTGNAIGRCIIYAKERDDSFPLRPFRVKLEIEGNPVPDALLGAAVARAKELCRLQKSAARIYTQIDPDDSENMDALSSLGFLDNDGIIRMRHDGVYERGCNLPAGCVVVKDHLNDPYEQKFFLERYNIFYKDNMDFNALEKWIQDEHFTRILIISGNGMVGEIIFRSVQGIGRIEWIFTAKKWRRLGIASSLLELACKELTSIGISRIEADIQARIPNILKTMERCGFVQDQLIARLPGIDIDA